MTLSFKSLKLIIQYTTEYGKHEHILYLIQLLGFKSTIRTAISRIFLILYTVQNNLDGNYFERFKHLEMKRIFR